MSRWIAENLGLDVPLHFIAFHPDWKMRDVAATPAATLTRAHPIAINNGLKFVYTGNVHDPAGGMTACPGCEGTVIVCDWYELTGWDLTPEGCCKQCGTLCPGVFERSPGDQGRKRQPLRMA